MTGFKRLAAAALISVSMGALGADPESVTYTPKFCIRTDNGILRNTGSQGGTSFSVGGIDLSFLYPIGPGLFLGIGYQAHFDFNNKTVPFTSLDLVGRAYFIGQGSRSKTEYFSMSSERLDRFNVYVATEFGRRDYYLGTINASSATPATNVETSGNSLGLNGALGADFRLSSSLQLTAEGNIPILNFASSDDRYVISGLLFKFGIAYVW